jgi:hypothetical protein
MASTQAICDSFKIEILTTGIHDFTITTGDVFKFALYTSTATHSATTTAYSTTNELPDATGGYTAGGVAGTNVTPSIVSANTVLVDFSNDVTWSTASFTAASALLYNSTNGNAAVAVYDFSGDKTASGGDFVLIMPARATGTALLQLA